LLLLTLATAPFTHVVDSMAIMPLGPQFMRLFDVGPREFGLLISSYKFAASGSVAAFWIDRFDHKRALLVLYAGFIVATAFTDRFGPAMALVSSSAEPRLRGSFMIRFTRWLAVGGACA
jgi:predicted MFS family arabinose efflux permease